MEKGIRITQELTKNIEGISNDDYFFQTPIYENEEAVDKIYSNAGTRRNNRMYNIEYFSDE